MTHYAVKYLDRHSHVKREASPGKLAARFEKKCRQVRHAHGLSQLDMVGHTDFLLSHYQKIERGGLDPRLTTVKRLADAFGVSMSELLDEL